MYIYKETTMAIKIYCFLNTSKRNHLFCNCIYFKLYIIFHNLGLKTIFKLFVFNKVVTLLLQAFLTTYIFYKIRIKN